MVNILGALIFFAVLTYAIYRTEDTGGLFGNPNLKQDRENARRLRRLDR